MDLSQFLFPVQLQQSQQLNTNQVSEMLSRVAPENIEYKHDNTWHDGNGHSHVRASLIGPSLTIPIVDGGMSLGTWQQIVVLELDTRPRNRNVILQLIGEYSE